VLVFGGAVVAQVVAEHNQSTGGPGLSSTDPAPGGALALTLWLEELGYQVVRIDDRSPGADAADVVFVLAPVRSLEEAEVEVLLGWVRRGGVLMYAPSAGTFASLLGGSSGADRLLRRLGSQLTIGPGVEEAEPSVPFFRSPRAASFRVGTFWSLGIEDPWVPLVEGSGQVVAATRSLGDGRVYLSASGAFFSNEGIERADNHALVLNALRRHPGARRVTFDEYHHQLLERPSLAAAARGSPWGWAAAYAAGLSFLFLIWGGRRFGPAVVAEQMAARSAGDYVAALGGLLQRARALGWAQQQYALLTRRRLGRILGVRPDLSPVDMAGLAASRGAVDAKAIAEHLAALDGIPLGQRDLLARVRTMEHILRGLESREP
jgi:hypothetical protein